MKLNPINESIKEFLEWYFKQKSPKYAVMITGEWGCGKTWLLDEIMKQREETDYLRISLFGVSSIQEIYDRCFAQIYPMLAAPGTQIVSGLAMGLLSQLSFPVGNVTVQPDNGSPDGIGIKRLMTNLSRKIIFFDDYERCTLPRKRY